MVGLLFAVVFSWNLWENWKQSPVLITIQTANYPVKPINNLNDLQILNCSNKPFLKTRFGCFQIKNYHFPTVTICSVNKVSTRALGEWMSTEK
jgi:hypothetical protein